MAKVDILLASYNGAKYIKSQILSIIGQQFSDWRLLVHDDGSSDDTVALVGEFAARDERIVLIEDGQKCGGAAENFMHLTRYATADYVMFADQDDVWFDNKVGLMVEVFEKRNHSMPQVLYSNSYSWRPDKGIEGLSTYTAPTTLRQFLFLNSGVQGCVAIFNQKMNDILKGWDRPLVMHDQVLHLAGVALGEVSYLHIPLMLYRKSGENLTGDTIVNKNDVSRIMANRKSPVVHRDHFDVVMDFYDRYKSRMSGDNRRVIEIYADMAKKNFAQRVISVLKNRFVLFDSTFRLIIKMALRPYIGNK